MGKTTDRYCVSYFLELKELRNLKIFTKNAKITPDLKESYSFFSSPREKCEVL